MPNKENVRAPVSLVGWGRSGTTLVTNVFRRHPDFFALGETTNVVLTLHRQIKSSLAHAGPIRGERGLDTAARDAVYAVLLELYGSDQPRWFQKPILLPKARHEFDSDGDFADWYWSTFGSLFPDGQVMTMIRDPAETVRSSQVRWGGTVEENFAQLEMMYRLLLHDASLLDRVFSFESLQQEPEAFVRDVLAFAGANFDQTCLGALKGQYAMNPHSDLDVPVRVPGSIADLYDELRHRSSRQVSSVPVTASGG